MTRGNEGITPRICVPLYRESKISTLDVNVQPQGGLIMPTLLIKMIDGKVYSDKVPMHFMVAENFELDYDLIADVGVKNEAGKSVWMGRKPM